MGTGDGLHIRRHERRTADLVAEVRVASGSGSQLRVSQSAEGRGTVRAAIADLSEGGVGLRSPLFFPRGARLSVRVMRPSEGGSEELFLAEGRVQRVRMLDRGGEYELGLAFVDAGADLRERVRGVLGEPPEGSARVA